MSHLLTTAERLEALENNYILLLARMGRLEAQVERPALERPETKRFEPIDPACLPRAKRPPHLVIPQ